jgi:hypothetical protein
VLAVAVHQDHDVRRELPALPDALDDREALAPDELGLGHDRAGLAAAAPVPSFEPSATTRHLVDERLRRSTIAAIEDSRLYARQARRRRAWGRDSMN